METMCIDTWVNMFNPEEINVDKIQEYLDFINIAIERCDPDRYCERHHILPKCFDIEKKYDRERAKVNGADHVKAHMLLVECFNGETKCKMSYAVSKLIGHLGGRLTLEEYEEAREFFALSQTGELNHAYGKPSYARGTVWITDGEHRKRIARNDPLPEGWQYGNPKFSNKGMIGITDGIHNKYIFSTDEIPEGWCKGNVGKAQHRLGESNGMYGKIWITDGSSNKLLPKDEPIPNGWWQGATQNNPDQHGTNSAIYGKVSITNGKESRLVYPNEPLPDGWRYGQKQNHSKYGNNRNQGKICITDGTHNKLIFEKEGIPVGWYKGMTRERRVCNNG